MIDLHTHTLLSDGELLPSELVRRAHMRGYSAIALTDHVDSSNIDFVVPGLVSVCKVLNKHWNIYSIPGAEITHAPLEEIKPLVAYARKLGARVVLVHGETLSEPVIKGTNYSAIEAGCDILAHPGLISRRDAELACERGVHLELTTRASHSDSNKHVFKMAISVGAKLVLDNDAHSDENLISRNEAKYILETMTSDSKIVNSIFMNSHNIVESVRKVRNKKVK